MKQVQYGHVTEPYWIDRPTIIVGAGPSLKGFNFRELDGLGHTLAVNGAMHQFPNADAWLTADNLFVADNFEFLSKEGPTLYVCRMKLPKRSGFEFYNPIIERAVYLERWFTGGTLSCRDYAIECGGTSGYSALNLAILKQARKQIFLFGFDYKGDGHFNDEVYVRRSEPHKWKLWAQMFNGAKYTLDQMNIEVINASPDSEISAFKKVSHYQALSMLHGK